jgi:hypothetical protein
MNWRPLLEITITDIAKSKLTEALDDSGFKVPALRLIFNGFG